MRSTGTIRLIKNGQFKNQKRYAMNVSFVHQITNQCEATEQPFKWIECDGGSRNERVKRTQGWAETKETKTEKLRAHCVHGWWHETRKTQRRRAEKMKRWKMLHIRIRNFGKPKGITQNNIKMVNYVWNATQIDITAINRIGLCKFFAVFAAVNVHWARNSFSSCVRPGFVVVAVVVWAAFLFTPFVRFFCSAMICSALLL